MLNYNLALCSLIWDAVACLLDNLSIYYSYRSVKRTGGTRLRTAPFWCFTQLCACLAVNGPKISQQMNIYFILFSVSQTGFQITNTIENKTLKKSLFSSFCIIWKPLIKKRKKSIIIEIIVRITQKKRENHVGGGGSVPENVNRRSITSSLAKIILFESLQTFYYHSFNILGRQSYFRTEIQLFRIVTGRS